MSCGSALYAVVDIDTGRMLPVAGVDNGDGTASLTVSGGGGGSSGEVALDAVPTDDNTSATPDTSTEAYAGNPDGVYLRLVNVSTTDSIRARLGGTGAEATDEVILPGGSFAPPYKVINALHVRSSAASVPYVLYVLTEA